MSKKVGPKVLAAKFARDVEIRVAETGLGMAQKPPEKPWEEFQREYLATGIKQDRRPATREDAERALNTFVRIVHPGTVPSVNAKMIDAFISERLKERGKKAGSRISPETVNSELRVIRAALRKARKWKYTSDIPEFDQDVWCKVDKVHKRMYDEPHFVATLTALAAMRSKLDAILYPSADDQLPCPAADWWIALLTVLWTSGQRITAMLELRWADVDLENGTAKSRAEHTKGRKDNTFPLHPAACEALRKIRGLDERVFAWNHGKEKLYEQFHKIQASAGINLPCNGKHEHTDKCHKYGFHDLRRSFVTLNIGEQGLDQIRAIVDHACDRTTKGYIVADKLPQSKRFNARLSEAAVSIAVG